jgi:hypothetical protein
VKFRGFLDELVPKPGWFWNSLRSEHLPHCRGGTGRGPTA